VDVCNVAPMTAGRRGLCNSGEAGGLGRAGTGRGGSRGVLGLVWGLGPSGNAAGDGARRRWPAAGAVRLVPADGRLGGREGTPVSCGRCQGTWRRHWSYKRSAGAENAPRRRDLCVGGGSVGQGRSHRGTAAYICHTKARA
jgi:hypothetical protein